ncbi:MAG: Arsenite oxidase subunit AioA [Nitrospira sp.]|nr:MAG: Arsenite oxidase subunit AioA [Nitrospira sp.]
MNTISHGEDRVPVPPIDAQQFTTVCSYCIVGCGYNVYKWPLGKEGGPKPHQNALRADFTKQQPERTGTWISPAMHNVITERSGRKFNVVLLPDHACVVNKGNHSVRGGTHADVLYAPDRPTADRLTTPLLYRGGHQLPTTWDDALTLGATIIKASLDTWGPDAIAMKFFDHGGGGGGFENNWAVGKFFFTGIGTQMASIHNRPAYNSEVFASGDAGIAPLPSAYLDAELADTILLIGANSYETQSIYFLEHMVPNLSGGTLAKKNALLPGEPHAAGKIIIVDPRRTATVAVAEAAAGKQNVLHLQLNNGTDIALLNSLSRMIYEQGWHDSAFIAQRTNNFEACKANNLAQDLDEAIRLTGISRDQMMTAAEWIAKPKSATSRRRTLVLYEKGLIWGLKNYENVASAVDLALLTGNLGKPGTGCGRLGGHQEGYSRPSYPGKRPPVNVDDVAIKGGASKVFWVAGCNPVGGTLSAQQFRLTLARRTALVNQALDATGGGTLDERVQAVLDALEQGGLFLIVQDIYPIETARYAHLVLPAAQWGEMNLTSINGERRLRLYQKFMDAPGAAEPDWKIMAMMAQTLQALYEAEGQHEKAARFSGFDWRTDEDVFRAAAAGVKGAQEDYGDTTYAMLAQLKTNGVQTPVKKIKDGLPVGTTRLFEDGGTFKFIPAPWPGFPPQLQQLMNDSRYPFWVNNGRSNQGWQTLYDDLRKPYVIGREPLPHVEIHPQDATILGVESGDLVELFNPYGTVTALAVVVESNRPGHVFMLFEHPKGWANSLTTDYVDPATTIPYYKGTKAGIRKIGALPELKEQLTFIPTNQT